MRYSMIASALVATAFAHPNNLFKRADNETSPCDDKTPCMTYAQAQVVANNYGSSVSAYSQSAVEADFSSSFTEYSDSTNTVIDAGCTGPKALGDVTFDSLASYESYASAQASQTWSILNLWHTCSLVAVRWQITGGTQEVTGIMFIETEYQDSTSEPFLIKTVYNEYNSGATLVNEGVWTPTCAASNSTKRDATSADYLPKALLPGRVF